MSEEIFRYPVAVERVNTLLTKKHTNTHESKFTPSKRNEACHAITSDFTTWGFVFEITL
jgi:ribosomal protein L23